MLRIRNSNTAFVLAIALIGAALSTATYALADFAQNCFLANLSGVTGINWVVVPTWPQRVLYRLTDASPALWFLAFIAGRRRPGREAWQALALFAAAIGVLFVAVRLFGQCDGDTGNPLAYPYPFWLALIITGFGCFLQNRGARHD